MLLEEFTLDEQPVAIAMNAVFAVLNQAQDNAGHVLLPGGAAWDVDSALTDISLGGMNASPEHYPMIRVSFGQVTHTGDASFGNIVRSMAQTWFYFLYYYGTPSTNEQPSRFQELRESHIRYCLNAMTAMPRTERSTGGALFNFPPQLYVEDHDTPFRLIDQTFRLPAGYACTRVDVSILTTATA